MQAPYPRKSKNWQRVIGEFQHNSDRSVAILGSTYLQNDLGRLLHTFFVDDAQNTHELLTNHSALGSFETRIRTAYALGLLAANEFNDLLQIAHIRDTFLNELEVNQFTDEALRQYCFLLKTPREVLLPEETVTPRRLFVFAVALLTGQLLRRSEQAERQRRTAPQNFILIDVEK